MKVSKLPEHIGHLHCLEMLDITNTAVYDLPASFVNLRRLAHFRVGQCVRFPDGIAKMQALETLKIVQTSMQSYNFLQELGELKNLRKLFLFTIHDVEHKEVVASSLRKLCLQNLSSLDMWNDCDNIVLNAWCMDPPLSLQKLNIVNSVLPKVPDWVGLLVNLQILRLEVMRIRHEDLCILGSLPALLTLFLRGPQGLYPCKDRKLAVPSEAGFRCLKMFRNEPWHDWIDLMFEARCMPKLEKLEINLLVFSSAQLESLSGPGAFNFGIENLCSLVTFKYESLSIWSGLSSTTVDAVKASLESAVSAHPNHVTLIFNHVNQGDP
ncbi:hypothetical protein VPH35_114064 [Triticum aestivum]